MGAQTSGALGFGFVAPVAKPTSQVVTQASTPSTQQISNNSYINSLNAVSGNGVAANTTQNQAALYKAIMASYNINPVNQSVESTTFWQQVLSDLKVALITGDYGQDVTVGSASYSMAAALAGVDIVADINSFRGALADGDYGAAALYGASMFPLVGAGVKAGKTVDAGIDAASVIGRSADVQIKDLTRLPNNIIKELGGEGYTQGAKQYGGRSGSNLYWDKDGNVYTVPNNGGPPQWVDTIPRNQ